MGRSRRIISLVGLLLAFACAVPAAGAAAASSYSWSQPRDFPTAAGATNPSADAYGSPNWSYAESDTAQTHSAGYPAIPGTYGALSNGLSGWQDKSDADSPFIAGDVSSTPSTKLEVQPAGDRFVAIGWTSPLAAMTPPAAVSATITPATGIACGLSSLTWTLELGGTSIDHGSATNSSPANVSDNVAVSPGQTVYLTIAAGGIFNAACDTAVVTFAVNATQPAPAVTLNDPGSAGATPNFTGTASDGFGYSKTVAVTVTPTSGSPIVLDATRSGTTYSVAPSSPLAPGQYTAQAAQQDAAGGSGQSAAVSFSVPQPPTGGNTGPAGPPGSTGPTGNTGPTSSPGTGTGTTTAGPPTVTLSPLRSAIPTGTPVLSGTAGTRRGDSTTVYLAIYAAGRSAPVRFLTAYRLPSGQWAVQVTPALPDGAYTAVAGEPSDGGPAYSPRIAFRVKANSPAVTLATPRPGARLKGGRLSLSGVAGSATGDSSRVEVFLFTLADNSGRKLGSRVVAVKNGRWSLTWPRRLALGLYTALVTQGDDVGHSSLRWSNFLVVPVPAHSRKSAR